MNPWNEDDLWNRKKRERENEGKRKKKKKKIDKSTIFHRYTRSIENSEREFCRNTIMTLWNANAEYISGIDVFRKKRYLHTFDEGIESA